MLVPVSELVSDLVVLAAFSEPRTERKTLFLFLLAQATRQVL